MSNKMFFRWEINMKYLLYFQIRTFEGRSAPENAHKLSINQTWLLRRLGVKLF
jgi:hypothetical protein